MAVTTRAGRAKTGTTPASTPSKERAVEEKVGRAEQDHKEKANGKAENTGLDEDLEIKEKDFFWTYTEEPHRTRRLAIIRAHPEVYPCVYFPTSNENYRTCSANLLLQQVVKLCGPEPLTKYVVLAVVSLQILLAYLLRSSPFWSPQTWLTAYILGATANQNLFLAIHEISHNLAFRRPLYNRLLAIFANVPIGLPFSASFRPYHLTHHKSLGVDGLDPDLPTALEAVFLDSVLGKAFFCTFQILFYAVRPIFVYRVPFTWVHWVNVASQALFDYFLYTQFGPNAVFYLILSSFLAGSLHPLAGHFIAEHYVYETVSPQQKSPSNRIAIPETFSYYGIANLFTYNVGFHNEHHDFPAVPWTRLRKLNEIAHEFYDELPQHESWTMVLWRFVWDKDVGIRCRVKRKQGGRIVGGGMGWKQSEVEA
jgi:sphingolipid delta-4 desaturase